MIYRVGYSTQYMYTKTREKRYIEVIPMVMKGTRNHLLRWQVQNENLQNRKKKERKSDVDHDNVVIVVQDDEDDDSEAKAIYLMHVQPLFVHKVYYYYCIYNIYYNILQISRIILIIMGTGNFVCDKSRPNRLT